jgi:hypothetical protein
MRRSAKTGLDLEEARRKREENVIELRKSKRDENLQKKRQTFTQNQYAAAEDSTKSASTAGGQRVKRRTDGSLHCFSEMLY